MSPHQNSTNESGDAQHTAAIAESILQGDFAAFYQVWEPHRPYLFKLCLRRMSGIREEAEDALSRAMLKAWERLPHHAHKIRHLKAWLAQLTLNLCADIHREQRRRACVFESIEELPAWRQNVLASTETPEESVLRSEFCFQLQALIAGLPTRLYEPFIMHFVHEMSYVDISEQLGLSTDNIRKRIQQARAILRAHLKDYVSGNRDLKTVPAARNRRAGGAPPEVVGAPAMRAARRSRTGARSDNTCDSDPRLASRLASFNSSSRCSRA